MATFPYRSVRSGFALPTVLISSVVMMTVLLMGLSSVTSVSASLKQQYINKISNEAAQSGINFISACVDAGYNLSTTQTYVPNSTSCTNAAVDLAKSPYVMNSTSAQSYPKLTSTYQVTVSLSGNKYTIKSIGLAANVRTSGASSSGSVTSSQALYNIYPIGIYGVASGNDTTCSIQTGKLYCWGNNSRGQVGDGTTTDVTSPTLIKGALDGKMTVKVATGIYHTCAIARNYTDDVSKNRLYCWGDNQYGQYGNNVVSSGAPYSLVPILALDTNGNGMDATDGTIGSTYYPLDVSARDHTCVMWGVTDSTPGPFETCWGRNDRSQSGEDSTTDAAAVISSPKMITNVPIRTGNNVSTNLTSVSSIANVSSEMSCSINASQVYCAGATSFGQFGNGMTSNWYPRAYAATGMNAATKIQTNNGRLCALNAGNLYCWGSNGAISPISSPWRIDSGPATIGQGNSAAPISSVKINDIASNASTIQYPTKVITSSANIAFNGGISDFAITDRNTCIVKTGKVYCWGYNNLGQLGQGSASGPSYSTASSPSQILAADDMVQVRGALDTRAVTSVTSGNDHFCAITSSKATYCWGWNAHGQLGDGTMLDRYVPTPVKLPQSITY